MRRSMLKVSILASALLLTACGDGWEVQKTDAYFPYANKRTAGSGVAYVRAKLLPEKELKVEAPAEVVVEEPVKEVAVPEKKVEPVLDAEEIFDDANVKGATSAPNKVIAPKVAPLIEDHTLLDDVIINAPVVKQAVLQEVETPAEALPSGSLAAEDYIAQAPKKIEIPDVVVAEEQVGPIEVKPAAGVSETLEDALNKVTVEEPSPLDAVEAVITTEEGGVLHPINELVAPKVDFYDLSSEGQKNLSEIYSEPFY